jgi:GT2 family glycosyltransferase
VIAYDLRPLERPEAPAAVRRFTERLADGLRRVRPELVDRFVTAPGLDPDDLAELRLFHLLWPLEPGARLSELWPGLRLRRTARLVATVHEPPERAPGALLVQAADAVLATSHMTAEHAVRRLGLDPRRVHLVGAPEGDDPAAWDDVAERLAGLYEALLARPRPRRRRPRVAVVTPLPEGAEAIAAIARRADVDAFADGAEAAFAERPPEATLQPLAGFATVAAARGGYDAVVRLPGTLELEAPETRPTPPQPEPPAPVAAVDRVHRRRGLSAPVLPVSDDPVASIVMVVRGAGDLALAALDALRRHTPEPFEVVLVDNGSADGTTARLAAVEGARLLRNRFNRGFGPACNQGAAEARAGAVVFLNSDALVTPGWLGPLLETLDRGAGAAAPMLLNPDGSLQEAGAIVWRSGGTSVHGFGDDPEKLEYRFRREIDYSGACLVVRRAAFAELGGFDDRYAPAYFEDADLGMRLRELGLPVVYDPRSKVVHVLGASGTTFEQKAVAHRNWLRFRERFEALLDRRPPEPPDSPPWAGRDALCDERVLIVDDAPTVGRLAEAAAEARRSLRRRVTYLATDPRFRADAIASALDAGLELAFPDDVQAWRAERQAHYDVVRED